MTVIQKPILTIRHHKETRKNQVGNVYQVHKEVAAEGDAGKGRSTKHQRPWSVLSSEAADLPRSSRKQAAFRGVLPDPLSWAVPAGLKKIYGCRVLLQCFCTIQRTKPKHHFQEQPGVQQELQSSSSKNEIGKRRPSVLVEDTKPSARSN